jgi:uncharacterized protein
MTLNQVIAAALCALLPAGVLAKPEVCPPAQSFKAGTGERPAQSDRFAMGMLWEIKRPNAPASYLFGTIHLAGLTRLPPAVALHLVQAEIFVAEAVLDQAAMTYYQQQMYARNGPNLATVFETPFRDRVLKLLANYGFERETALMLRPWAAFTLLSRPKPTGAPTLDQTLEAMARERGIPVRGLQSVEELVATLADIPLDDQRQIVIDTVCNRALIAQQTRALTTEYLEQDLAGMLAVSDRFEPHDKSVAKRFKQRLLDHRNQHMLQRLKPYLKAGGAFIAVGALHLPGKAGLLQGLTAQGYRVRAIF